MNFQSWRLKRGDGTCAVCHKSTKLPIHSNCGAKATEAGLLSSNFKRSKRHKPPKRLHQHSVDTFDPEKMPK